MGTLLNTIITAQWERIDDVGLAKVRKLLPPMPDHKGVYATITPRDPPTPFLSEFSEI